MRRSFAENSGRRWAIIIANAEGSFWDFVRREPYVKDLPYLFPNEASARAYAAWKLDWASQRYYPSTKQMLPINLDTFDPSSIKLSWPTALDAVVASTPP
jgi:hypothetical protein